MIAVAVAAVGHKEGVWAERLAIAAEGVLLRVGATEDEEAENKGPVLGGFGVCIPQRRRS